MTTLIQLAATLYAAYAALVIYRCLTYTRFRSGTRRHFR